MRRKRLNFQLLFLCILLLNTVTLIGQQTENAAKTASYLEQIRPNTAQLTAFFSAMPKGGDLHHHFSGSVFGETYLEFVTAHDELWINTESLKVEYDKPEGLSATAAKKWKTVATLKQTGDFSTVAKSLMRRWSVMDYDQSRPSHEQFLSLSIILELLVAQ